MSRVQLKSDGTILLGGHVSCDGFAYGVPFRVQTHIHQDHMVNFGTSKANQTILVSPPTCDLLCALYNADLPHRTHTNLARIGYGTAFCSNGDSVRLLPSNHMLGSAQVEVTCSDGYRIGYSSDFFWPVDEVIQVDELIVDATYGDPLSVRRYDQQDVDEKLIALAHSNLKAGKPTAVIGHNGRLQYALHIIGNAVQVPLICSPKAYPLVTVYAQHGYPMPSVLESKSDLAIEVLRERLPCLAFVTLGERRHLPWVDRLCKISLSAYMQNSVDPVMHYDNGDCCVALTDHADFQGTLDYVRATEAKTVWTDPRSGNAEALALAISESLGLEARMAHRLESLAWG